MVKLFSLRRLHLSPLTFILDFIFIYFIWFYTVFFLGDRDDHPRRTLRVPEARTQARTRAVRITVQPAMGHQRHRLEAGNPGSLF